MNPNHKGYRQKIRDFLDKVDWATPENICYLLKGTFNKELENDIDTELWEMTRAKKKELSVLRLQNLRYHVYAKWDTKKKDKGCFQIEHDISLRNCLAKYFFENWEGNSILVKLDTFADAYMDTFYGKYYFEMDNGHMTADQLRDKLQKHYTGQGKFRVIFWMASPRTQDKELTENNRLNILWGVVKDVLRHKPNRVLGACYTQYLTDGKLRTMKGEEL